MPKVAHMHPKVSVYWKGTDVHISISPTLLGIKMKLYFLFGKSHYMYWAIELAMQPKSYEQWPVISGHVKKTSIFLGKCAVQIDLKSFV